MLARSVPKPLRIPQCTTKNGRATASESARKSPFERVDQAQRSGREIDRKNAASGTPRDVKSEFSEQPIRNAS